MEHPSFVGINDEGVTLSFHYKSKHSTVFSAFLLGLTAPFSHPKIIFIRYCFKIFNFFFFF